MDWKRIAVVTAGLAGAGMVVGGMLAGGLAVALDLSDTGGVNLEHVLPVGVVGAVVGAVLGPLAGWLLMRHVPLWLAIGGTALGTLAGIGASLATNSALVLFPLLGFFVSALALRLGVARRERARISA